MLISYAHTNIIAEDWRRLADFYARVFGFLEVPPQRNLSGEWLERGTGVRGAALQGIHLRLPGHGAQGPTLEIYSYTAMEEKLPAAANRKGLGHLAFRVENVAGTLDEVISAGGRAVGEIATTEVPGAGRLTFCYAADPEGNLVEIQSWG
ncbi:MAG TPA: VOC family protein [Thermodesulfobacteriota bacterium]|nr:VOC family protein [Thermodesulfobacteriota bacterium]